MNEPDDPAAKNEQELNLFSDQTRQDESPAEPESSPDAAPADTLFEQTMSPEPSDPASVEAEPAHDYDEPEREVAPPISAQPADDADDSPVVAPPPRKQAPSARPGIVLPRTGRASFPQNTASPAAARPHRPLPHTLQSAQSLGQMLTAIRNARGQSLEEVALATRIRTEYLIELESDKLLKTLPSVYVSAYVRKLIEVYDLSKEDGDLLLEKMRGETPQNSEELPEKLMKEVNDGALVNEGENKRIRYITIIVFSAIGLIVAALIWLAVLVIVRYAGGSSEPAPGHDPAAANAGAVTPAEEPVARTARMDESELDALIVPETPSISVLKMSKSPGVRDSL